MARMAAQITVRPAADDDDLDALNAGSLSWSGQGLLRAMFAASSGVPLALLVAEVDGVPAGFASTVGHGYGDGRRGLAHVYVLPAHRGKGAGTALWQAVLQVCTPARVPGISSQLAAADTATIDLLLARGWQLMGLHHESELDLTDIDHLEALRHLPDGSEVVLAPLPDDSDEDRWHAFGRVYARLMRDAPDVAAGAEDMPYPVLRAVIAEPWQVMGAWDGEQLVGLTAVAVRDPARGRLNTWFTGVDPGYRSRGLATALKTAQAFAVRDAGWRTIVTQNMEGNDAILAANDRLGFKRGAGLRDVVYDFTQ
jgi:GNAT superfamily N-acetyltransferase